MISVTRLNGTRLYVNAELIKYVEATPDSIITLTDGSKLLVRETPERVAQLVVAYRQDTLRARLATSAQEAG